MTRLCIAATPCEHWADPARAGYPGLKATIATHCQPIRGSHLDACAGADPRCPGCMPRVAEDGLLVCPACRLRMEDRVAELPTLWADLLRPTRVSAPTRSVLGEDRPLALGDAARNARDSVHRLLTMLAATAAPRIPIRRPTTPGGMALRISAHLPRLLDGPDPDAVTQLVHDVDTVWREAHRRAYPAAPAGSFIGACTVTTPDGLCGGPVRAEVDDMMVAGWAVCGTCRTGGALDWWQAQMPDGGAEWLGMRDLRWHLVLHCHRQIGESTIRGWAAPSARDPWPALPSVVDIASRRPLYRVEEARELCGLNRRRGRPRSAPVLAGA